MKPVNKTIRFALLAACALAAFSGEAQAQYLQGNSNYNGAHTDSTNLGPGSINISPYTPVYTPDPNYSSGGGSMCQRSGNNAGGCGGAGGASGGSSGAGGGGNG